MYILIKESRNWLKISSWIWALYIFAPWCCLVGHLWSFELNQYIWTNQIYCKYGLWQNKNKWYAIYMSIGDQKKIEVTLKGLSSEVIFYNISLSYMLTFVMPARCSQITHEYFMALKLKTRSCRFATIRYCIWYDINSVEKFLSMTIIVLCTFMAMLFIA